jgi:hypothetical protein
MAVTEEELQRLKMDRAPCPVCQWPLWEYDIALGTDTEEHSYVCPRCDHMEIRTTPRLRFAS